MDPLTMSLIMGGAGLLKSELVDKKRAEAERKLAAETQRLSPWTGLKANAVKEADPFGTALQFGATGAMMGENMSAADLNAAKTDRLNSGGNLFGYGQKMDDFSAEEALPLTQTKPKQYGSWISGYRAVNDDENPVARAWGRSMYGNE